MEELKNEIIALVSKSTNYDLLMIISRFVKRLLS